MEILLRKIACGMLSTLVVTVSLGFGCISATSWFITERANQKQRANQLNDSSNYGVDLSELLGLGWYNESTSLIDDQEDVAGWDPSIAGSTEWVARNFEHELVYVKYSVITYLIEEVAYRRYLQQENLIFEFSFGGPHSRQQFPYHPANLPDEMGAQQGEAACENVLENDVLKEARCTGLLLYGNHIAFVDAFLARDFEEFLTLGRFNRVLVAIDQVMLSPEQ